MDHTELQKRARSAASLMGKMKKAVADYNVKVAALTKAHQDDMEACFGKMHKILGVEEADKYGADSPQGQDVQAQGTTNLQDFGKAQKPVAKAAAADEDASSSSSSSSSSTTTPGAKGAQKGAADAGMTKADVTEMFNEFAKVLMTALVGKAAGDEDASASSSSSSSSSPANKAAKKAAGVGDRDQMGPIMRNMPVTKAADNRPAQQQAQHTDEPVDVAKALGGDASEALKLMRGVKPGDLPNTLVEPLSKLR